MGKYHYMTRDERLQLEALRKAKIPITKIAAQLGFSRQTIYNELQRGQYNYIRVSHGYYYDDTAYSADKGQQIHEYNQSAKGRQLKIDHDHQYAEFLEEKILKDKYSPAAALAEARKAGYQTKICTTTLYSYIDKGVFLKLSNKHLWNKGSRRKRAERPERRVVHKKLPSIEQRPEWINTREELGHWEMDLIIGKAGSSPVLLTLTERASRYELIFKLPDKKAATIRDVFDQLERQYPDSRSRFRSITTDNGSEFLEYDKLIESIHGGKRFDVYYCHSYSAWEKGSVENHNRMIRRFFPKGTDFSKVSKKRIADVQNWMNNYPRKILGWAAPADLAA